MNLSIGETKNPNPTMDDLNFICETHNSPIGGICSDLFCKDNSLLCIMCAVGEDSCIRKYNHEMITFEEFFKKYDIQLNQKFPNKEMNTFEFLKYLKELQLDKIEADYLAKIEERSGINQSLVNEMKEKIVSNGMKTNMEYRTKKINEAIDELDNVEKEIKIIKEKGLDFVIEEDNKNLISKIEVICGKYSEFQNLKEKLAFLLEDRIVPDSELSEEDGVYNTVAELIKTHSNQNTNLLQTSFTDYQFTRELIKLMKFLLQENKFKRTISKFADANSTIQFYDNKNKEIEADRDAFKMKEIEDFNFVLSSIELSIPSLISKMLKEYSQEESNHKEGETNYEYSNLRKYVSGDMNESKNIFSYSVNSIFNTSYKVPYNQLDPTLLKFTYTLVTDFQVKNTLMDMICFFNLKDGTEYMAYSSATNSIKLINLTKNPFGNNMPSTSLPVLNTGVIYKIEHYRSQEGVDYLISLSSDKTLNKFEYNLSTGNFESKEKINLKSMAYAFEIVEIDKIPYVIVAPYNSELCQYKLTKFSELTKRFSNTINTYTYSMKAFYNKYTEKYQLVASAHDSILIYDINSGNLWKTLKSDENNWYLSFCILDLPYEKDYCIVSNIQKNVGVFKINSDKMIRKMTNPPGISTVLFRGIDMWNEKHVCVGNENSKIYIYNIDTGKHLHTICGHTKSVGGVKRYTTKAFGDVLISFSIDGTIKLWSC